MNRAVLLFVALSSVGTVSAACAGNAISDSSGAGGPAKGGAGSGSGGQAGSAPAQGNLTISVQPPSTGAATCPVLGKTYVLGNPKGPNSVQPGDRLIDGEQGAIIQCSVHGTGPYTFFGTLSGVTSELEQLTLGITDGVVDAQKQTGTATMVVNTPSLAGSFASPVGGCTISVIAQNVRPGSLWATASCPTITDPSTGKVCAVGAMTTFVLENCDGS